MTKEIKITPPEGYEIDKENSTFECIKFKPVVKRWRDGNNVISGYYVDGDTVHLFDIDDWNNWCHNHDVFATEKQAKSSLIHGAEWADQHPHWISVDDELPKIGKDVLVLREDGEMQVAHQYNEEIARWWSVDGFPLKNNITHWMPLPSIEGIKGNQGETSPNQEGGEE